MKKLSARGFSIVELLLVIVIVGIIGGLGFYVYNANKSTDKDIAASDNSEKVQAQSKTGDMYALKAPEGWDTLVCDKEDTETNPKMTLVYPSNDKAEDCEDRTNVVWVEGASVSSGAYSDKCLTEQEVAEVKKDKPLDDYTCTMTKINGVETRVTEANNGGGPTTDYLLKGRVVYVSVTGESANAAVVKQVAESVTFK